MSSDDPLDLSEDKHLTPTEGGNHTSVDVDNVDLVDGEELWTTEQFAEFIGIPKRSADDMRYRGVGPPYVKVGRLVRYRKADVLEWLEDRTVRSTSDEPAAE